MRPFESMRWEAKRELINVDFPSPVWPVANTVSILKRTLRSLHTNTDDIELETTLQQLLLDLLGDTVETNMAPRENRISLVHRHGHSRLQLIQKYSWKKMNDCVDVG